LGLSGATTLRLQFLGRTLVGQQQRIGVEARKWQSQPYEN
jgi:hypothetical protein